MKGHHFARTVSRHASAHKKISMSKARLIAIVFLVAILACLAGIYSRKLFVKPDPADITLVETYTTYPPSFPEELIKEKDYTLSSASVSTRYDGRKETKIEYTSYAALMTLVSLYENTAVKNGWAIKNSELGVDMAKVTGTRNSEELTMNFSQTEQRTTVSILFIK